MGIQITRTVPETRQALAAARARGQTIGFVPTMGALHAGHASLIRQARKETGCVVVSIFVNPMQFAPTEDLARYPRPFKNDLALCQAEGADVLFHPTPEVMYPQPFWTHVEVPALQATLCGQARPTHFRGVATVVLKLFNIVQPDVAYFGQKDAQQARLIEQMTRDLNVPTEIRIAPIVREADGLALSSRNVYLSPAERAQAPVLHRTLLGLRQRVLAGEKTSATLIAWAQREIATAPLARLDYVSLVNLQTLQPVDLVQGAVLAALAVRFGATRLIDNLVLDGGA